MRVLRGNQPVTKVTAVFVLIFSAATLFSILTPRAASAEGFLLPTVKCVVSTLLSDGCRSNQTPAPAPAAPAQQNTSSSTVQQSTTPRQTAPTTSQQGVRQQFEPIQEPVPHPESIAPIEDAPAKRLANTSHIDESEYVAYFNTYSKYAVQGAAGRGDSQDIIQAGPEGWKVIGIAWYWWLLGVASVGFVGWYGMTKYRQLTVK